MNGVSPSPGQLWRCPFIPMVILTLSGPHKPPLDLSACGGPFRIRDGKQCLVPDFPTGRLGGAQVPCRDRGSQFMPRGCPQDHC